jgi:hypothetical protein
MERWEKLDPVSTPTPMATLYITIWFNASIIINMIAGPIIGNSTPELGLISSFMPVQVRGNTDGVFIYCVSLWHLASTIRLQL